MKPNALHLLGMATALLTLSATAMAADTTNPPTLADRLDLGLNVGSLGLGGQVSWLLVPGKLSLRVGAHAYNYNHDTSADGIDYTGKLKLKNEMLTLDWHPFEGRFHLSAGVVANGNKFDLNAKPSAGGTYTINGKTYTAAQVGTLSAKVDFPSTAPYLGIGWGDSTTSAGLHFIGDIGVISQGTPRAKITATGAAADPSLATDVQQAEAQLRNKLADFKLYPVLQLGLAYRF
ncbi:MAG: hypothetical protein KA375_10400 [Vitreoscilla sp.]|nr:hypothetical protein [Burkholderiales bacterium]MBP6337999.1 hypothetical protein [Vitreoscilla sp.]MBP6674983.1 hypothetical protein [Vitreoscilla sp.]